MRHQGALACFKEERNSTAVEVVQVKELCSELNRARAFYARTRTASDEFYHGAVETVHGEINECRGEERRHDHVTVTRRIRPDVEERHDRQTVGPRVRAAAEETFKIRCRRGEAARGADDVYVEHGPRTGLGRNLTHRASCPDTCQARGVQQPGRGESHHQADAAGSCRVWRSKHWAPRILLPTAVPTAVPTVP